MYIRKYTSSKIGCEVSCEYFDMKLLDFTTRFPDEQSCKEHFPRYRYRNKVQ